MGKSQRKLADEAYQRSVEQLEGRAPIAPGVLPGQIDMLTGEIAGSTEKVEHYAHDPHGNEPVTHFARLVCDHIPDHCPQCGKHMHLASGWTPLHAEEGDPTRVMCGNCGQVAEVPFGEWKVLSLALAAQYRDVDRWSPPLKPEKKGKTRGAG